MSPVLAGGGTGSIRVGIDLCAASDVADSIASFGDRYLRRIFTDAEIATCSTAGRPEPERLAARFAAKEATVKALQPTDVGLDLHHIEVTTGAGGWVGIHLSGAAAGLAEAAGIHDLAVSITHEGGMAAAVVIAQAGAPAPSSPPLAAATAASPDLPTHATPTNEGGNDVH